MSTFKQLQHKSHLTSTPTIPTWSLQRPSRPFAPISTPASEQVSPNWRAQLESTARFGHSFDRISLFPSGGPSIEERAPRIQRKIRISYSSQEAIPQKEDPSMIRRAAQEGVQAPSATLPFAVRIQQSFGRYNVGQIQAHLGTQAAASAGAMHAAAYTMGEHVVFAETPDLHTAAHEAAHVIQQRGGIQLQEGIGKAGDVYEQQADVVANRVTAEQSVEHLLDRFAGQGDGKHGTAGNSGLMSSPTSEVAVLQRQIHVGDKEYSLREAFRLLRLFFTYQYDERHFGKQIKQALQLIELAHMPSFANEQALWDTAFSLALELPTRRRRRHRRQVRRDVLDLREFQDTENLAKEILRRFPPAEFFYVGLGRSPTPIIAYLFRLNHDGVLLQDIDKLVINLPLSGFRPLLPKSLSIFGPENPHKLDKPLTGEQQKVLYEHFDKFLPEVSKLGTRKVLLIDYSQSSRALIAATQHIQAYLAKHTSMLSKVPMVVPLALCVEEYLSTVKASGLENIIVIPGSLEEKESLAYKIGGGEYYDPQSEYGPLYITKGETTKDVKGPNPSFSELEHDMYVRSKGYEPLP